MSYFIVTDSASDLSQEYIDRFQVDAVCPLSVNYPDGSSKPDGFTDSSPQDFYAAMRAGQVTTTSQVNVAQFIEAFDKGLSQGKDVLYIGFSEGLSGTVQSAQIAKSTLEENPDKQGRIHIVSSLCASGGGGLLVATASQMRAQGKAIEEVAQRLEDLKLHLNHWFTVEDLVYLKRGGRISAIKAAMGGLLDIKPIMHVNNEGKLIPVTKAKGRKKSIHSLLAAYQAMREPHMDDMAYITHGDCLEDAEQLAIMIREAGAGEVLISNVGSVVGSHSGPGTLALFFYGKNREDLPSRI